MLGAVPAVGNNEVSVRSHRMSRSWTAPDDPGRLLGDEPPLTVDGAVRRGLDTRRVNMRWFSGTVLTGLCGAGLMGGVVWAALANPTRPPAPADVVQPLARASAGTTDRPTNTQRKGDRLTPLADVFTTSKQTIRVSQTIRTGDREIIRVRPHTRVVANLVQTSSGDFDIPEFNPLRLLAGDTAERAEESEPDTEAEMTVVTRDMVSLPQGFAPMLTVSSDEVIAKVREAALGPARGLAAEAPAVVGLAAPPGDEEQAAGTNVTRVLKAATTQERTAAAPDRTEVANEGDTVASILMALGATRDDARAVATAFGRGGREITLRTGQHVRVLFGQGQSGRNQPVRVILLNQRGQPEAAVALSDEGRYVAMEDPADAATITSDEDEEDDGQGLRLHAAIYETALRQEIPKAIIDEMIRIFAHDIDFSRRVGANDFFEVFYTSDEDGDAGRGDILYASLNTGGEQRRYYRFHNQEDGVIDFYDEQGKSARQFLIRKPIMSGQMRSGFGMRRHPVFGYYKMHSGVDWSDRIGTPILAAGNGTVVKAGWAGGYGRRIEIEHANGYTSTYSHLSGFARGISDGSRVRQGQVIGYLGNSGLSTGPHLHYEVMVNGRFVDPMRVRVPRGRELDGRALVAFRAERERINALMTRDRAETRINAAAPAPRPGSGVVSR